jgi:hypothetical protein
MNTLTFHVKRRYFDEMKSGEKKMEFRLRTPYWEKRLGGRTFCRVRILLGYPSRYALSRNNCLYFEWAGCDLSVLNHEQFGPVDVVVFRTHLGGLL